MKRVILITAAAFVAAGLSGCSQMNREEHTFTVESKDRVCDSERNCYFEVYGTNGEVFTNQDDLINGKFDSASVQAKLKPGHTYTVKTTGWRVPLLSMKPNIYDVTETN